LYKVSRILHAGEGLLTECDISVRSKEKLMTLERWRPRVLRPWRASEEMDRLMEEAFSGWPFGMRWRRLPAEEMAWAPSIDMYEKEDSFIVRAEIPGVKKEDVDISIRGEMLTIKGERKAEAQVKEEEYHRCEVCYGSFSRSLSLPAAVDSDKVEATYEDGMLEIRLPKAKEAMPTRIQVQTK
jgi:HSP20 family protein